jgi:DNA-binding NarL/FixJ family response regulator
MRLNDFLLKEVTQISVYPYEPLAPSSMSFSDPPPKPIGALVQSAIRSAAFTNRVAPEGDLRRVGPPRFWKANALDEPKPVRLPEGGRFEFQRTRGNDLTKAISQARSDPDKTLLFEICSLDKPTIKTLTCLRASYPSIPVIVVLESGDMISVIKVLASGIRGCLIKPAEESDLSRAAQEVRNCSVFLCRRAQELVIRWVSSAGSNLDFGHLSAREREIAYLLLAKRSDKEIAQELNISPGTVHVHLAKIYKRLGVHSRGELSMRMFQSGEW